MKIFIRFLVIFTTTLSITGCLDSVTVMDSAATTDGTGTKGNYYKNISHFDTGYIELTLAGPVGDFDGSSNDATIFVRFKDTNHYYGCTLSSLDALGQGDVEADVAAFGYYESDPTAPDTASGYIGSNLVDGDFSANNVFALTDVSEKKFGCGITRDGNGVETITAYLNRQPISQYVIGSSSIGIPGDGSVVVNDPGLDHDGLAGFSLTSNNIDDPLKIKSFVIYDKLPQ